MEGIRTVCNSCGFKYDYECAIIFIDDVRKMEMLDSKIALLINRSGIDPLDYGGKNPDEYANSGT